MHNTNKFAERFGGLFCYCISLLLIDFGLPILGETRHRKRSAFQQPFLLTLDLISALVSWRLYFCQTRREAGLLFNLARSSLSGSDLVLTYDDYFNNKSLLKEFEPQYLGSEVGAVMGHGGKVFVTVGTTSFDALIKAVDSQESKAAIARHGYSSIVLQLGRGSYLPSKDHAELKVDFFTFAPDLKDHMKSADLVISHAGSGSIFETLRMGKPLIVVVNEALMDNHQAELAEELAAQKYLFYASPRTLAETITNMDLDSLVPYTPSNPSALVKSLNSFFGFHSD